MAVITVMVMMMAVMVMITVITTIGVIKNFLKDVLSDPGSLLMQRGMWLLKGASLNPLPGVCFASRVSSGKSLMALLLVLLPLCVTLSDQPRTP